MSNPNEVWNDLQNKLGDGIGIWCEKCVPSSVEELRKNCEHAERNLLVYCESSTNKRTGWTTTRERPANLTDQLCSNPRCKGTKKCVKAHSQPELEIWKILEIHKTFLRPFIKNLIYYEEDNAPKPIKTTAKLNLQSRRNRNTAKDSHNTKVEREKNDKKFDQFLRSCGGKRFLFACNLCYHLDPKIIKEMEIGDGIDPRIYCSLCGQNKAYLTLHESKEKYDNGVRFYEYHKIRDRLSTSNGNELCTRLPNCHDPEECTFAHSFLELLVWKLETFEPKRIGLVRYCNRKADIKRETLKGMFHCERCCISFSDYQTYRKYMGSNHKHYADIHLPHPNNWIFRPLPKEETLSMCKWAPWCHKHQSCSQAHTEEELQEWKLRMTKKTARSRFRFQPETESCGFNLYLSPKHIRAASDVKIEVASTQKTIPSKTKTTKWNFKLLTSNGRFLKRLWFPHQSDFQIRSATDRNYSSLINMLESKSKEKEFFVLFTNPDTCGRHVGYLIFEFTDSEGLYYLRFEVEVKGESLCVSERVLDPNDWTLNRLIAKQRSEFNSYENTVRELESKYALPKVIDDIVGMTHIALNNYKQKMHSLLYREEHTRRTVLSRFNTLCEVKFHNFYDNGHLFADFSIPWSTSTDEGLLLRDSCNMVYLGEENGDHAYECKKESVNDENIRIALSSECVTGLRIEPGSSRKLGVQFPLDRETFCLRHYAVDKVEASLVCPALGRYASLQHNCETVVHENLNDMQNAIFNYVKLEKQKELGDEQKSFPPLIVVGPFGSGKTHTIKEITLDLIKNDRENFTILLCTRSNSSADLYVKDQRLQQWASKILRLYHHKCNPVEVEDSVKKFCLLSDSRFRYPRMDEIRKKRLVITTFDTALTLVLTTGLQKNAFTHIFLDEVSQAMEAEVIIPLLLADRRNTRILLAGDHRQMTEKLYSDQSDQIQTLLERMYEAYESGWKRCRILLTKNYRSSSGVISLLTKLFYKENTLDNAGAVECIRGMESAYFFHVKGECTAKHGEYVNVAEASQISELAKNVVEERLAAEQDILAISAYYPQVRHIREVLKRNKLPKVSVQSVANIQGQQFKVVLVSCVMRRVQCLETHGENLGFLSDYRLLNTVLTRAQSLIMVVGDAVTLCSVGKCERYWKAFLQHCEENNTFLPENINIESVKKEILLVEQNRNVFASELTPEANSAEDYEDSERTNEVGENQETLTEDLSQFYDGDDSWCFEDSVDDLILDDMVKNKIGRDLKKLTVGVGKYGDEYICYSSGDENDPNETSNVMSRQKNNRSKAIHPKFTVGHLEQMLQKNTGGRYKRCKLVMENSFSARAIPIRDNTDDGHLEKVPPSASLEPSTKSDASEDGSEDSVHDSEPESDSENEAVQDEALATPVIAITPAKINPTIFIETRRYLGRTFDKDEVLVKIIKTRNNPSCANTKKQIGRVLGVLQKRNLRSRHFLCRPDQHNSSIMCPFDKKVTKFAILTPKNHTQAAGTDIPIYKAVYREGKWMDLDLLRYRKADDCTAYIVRYLKWSDHCAYPLGFVEGFFDLGDYTKFLQLEYGVPSHYRKAVLSQANAVKDPKPGKGAIEVFTIDPEGSVDLDDAISFQKCPSHAHCFEIGIHITDVASVIKEGSQLDKEAMRRVATFYGGDDGPVHMLPPVLSANKCSILPGELRRAISTYFHSRDGPPHAKDFNPVTPKRTHVKSVRKLTYGEAERLLRDRMKDRPLSPEDLVFANSIREMWNIMWDWRVNRLRGEAFYKNTDSYTDLFAECRSHLLIEEAMVSVNVNTGLYLRDKGFDIPMRVQDAPDEKEWTDWNRMHTSLIPNSTYLSSCTKYLKKLKKINEGCGDIEADLSEGEHDGHWEEIHSRKRQRNRKKMGENLVSSSVAPIKDISIFENYWKDMLICIEENDFELFSFVAACDDLHPSMISSADGFRSLQKKATMSMSSSFHFSLRISDYAWSSSPIRRYVDIAIQRCIYKALKQEQPEDVMISTMKEICRCYDDRHVQYEKKLIRANLATSLQKQPIVFEACIVQITDAFIRISIPPLGKLMMRQDQEIDYGCLMVTQNSKTLASDTFDYEQNLGIDGKIVLPSIELSWELRYYEYGKKVDKNEGNNRIAIIKIPTRSWRSFVKIISKPPRLSDSDYAKERHLASVRDAVSSLAENSSRNELCRVVEQKEFTRNAPDVLPHKRYVQWSAMPGTSVLVQLSGSLHEDSKLPVPTVQLFSIDKELDVCVEHMRKPLETFVQDAAQSTQKVTSLFSYRKKWEVLVRMDAAYNATKENTSLVIKGVSVIWKKVIKQESSKDKFLAEEEEQAVVNCFELDHSFCYDRYIDFHRGDLICLRLNNVPCAQDAAPKRPFSGTRNTYTEVTHGIITTVIKPKAFNRSKKDHVEVRFKIFKEKFLELRRDFFENVGNKWTIQVLPLSSAHRQMHAALSALRTCSPLVESICLGTIQPSRINWPDATEKFVDKQLKKFPFQLNDKQKSQEQHAVRHNFSLIQGPPGTGKSFLGAQIAAKFAYINKQVCNGQKVLYCGPSNKSVDVAAGFLKDVNDLKVVRMYSHTLEGKLYPNPLKPRRCFDTGDNGKMPDKNLTLVTLHKLIRSRENPHCDEILGFDAEVKSGKSFEREEMDKYAMVVKEAKLYELEKADIIICTCSVACQLKGLKELKLSQCIIDECAMCSEPEGILPLVSIDPKQIVLIGDHMQLKPVITCTRAEKLGLGISLFSRYSEYTGMLTNQYRMHPSIMEFPSKQFYSGRLTCDDSVQRRPRRPFLFPKDVIFWNLSGEEKTQRFKTTEEGYMSKYNMVQAMAVVKILQRLTKYRILPSQIMILSPYTAQCTKIRKEISLRFNQETARNFHVGTVATSQGSEADYVIISTVRSLPSSSIMENPNAQWLSKNLGFLADPHQINVALTRARDRLVIIGNKRLLRTDALWNNLLSFYESKNAVTDNLIQT